MRSTQEVLSRTLQPKEKLEVSSCSHAFPQRYAGDAVIAAEIP
jgi:hypothetical protein